MLLQTTKNIPPLTILVGEIFELSPINQKGGSSTYCRKGEVMVASPEQLITLGIWEYQRIQRIEK